MTVEASAKHFTRLFAILLLLALTACAAYGPYRTKVDEKATACASPSACKDLLYISLKSADDETNEVQMGFVEFDDQGYMETDLYKDKFIRALTERARKHPQLIVVYAHGWKNSSISADTDRFAKMLVEIARRDHAACATEKCSAREVTGVYIGWRGLDADVEPLKSFSFWSRKSRAHRVGIDGATEVISQLEHIKETANASTGKSGETKLILTGHSFGAALIYSATQQLLMRDLTFKGDAPNSLVPNTTADLIVLVNPAFEAARAHALHLLASKQTFDGQQRPILAVFTAVSDTDTGHLFPLGRGLSTSLMHYENDRAEQTDCCSVEHQREENRTTIGKFKSWQTHELVLLDESSSVPKVRADALAVRAKPPASILDTACAWQSFQTGDAVTWSMGPNLRLARSKSVSGQLTNPYMMVSVADGIIEKHTEIWTDNFATFLYDFIAVQAVPTAACTGWRPKDAPIGSSAPLGS